ncbi:MAG: diguanylate cyclase [Candidatus Aminicenantes bacterium]|nr:diguanylate cyclase [Candidatus Aminicenantes bacterium]
MKKSLRILVVDDEETFRSTLKEFLAAYGHYILDAGNGVQALEVLDKADVDLIISDMRLPKMDGITFTHKVIEMERDIPVIVMTAYASIESAVEAMKAGAADFITKPFKFKHILFIIERVLENKQLKEMAVKSEYYKNLSNLDGMTGLYNYRFFKEMLQQEIERHHRYNRPLSLLMIDIDDFKQVNDSYGHLVGDQVLKQISTLLKESVRSCDMVARYGGEEFAVILPETAEEKAIKVSERIVSTTRGHEFKLIEGEAPQNLSVTVGLASFPKDAEESRQLIEYSDHALYAGKKAGKDQVSIYSENKKKSGAQEN